MNYSGSSRKLIGNAISAMLAAIEVYNKPRFAYRDEVTIILLTNAWELLFKAIISKNKKSIYYRKKRHGAYRTLSLDDAAKRAIELDTWPSGISGEAIIKNVEMMSLYRDNAVHFYNESNFGVVLYSLAQTAIYNFRDIASRVFNKDIADEMSWQIIPLGTRSPIDPIEYLKKPSEEAGAKRSRAVQDYLRELKRVEGELEATGIASDRLLTLYSVTLQSKKKVADADIVVAISSDEDIDGSVIQKPVDPNDSYPYRQSHILTKLPEDRKINGYKFQAITSEYGLRNDPRYCWKELDTGRFRWSGDVIPFIKNLTDGEISWAIKEYGSKNGSRARLANLEKRNNKPPKPRPW
ncbi:DUF3644 domain-containing protein [Sciscionella marina]|uniref:DUF3644 domain-containing protein n=1 Tax=Sciscionella marina TaxID=508770 RepID=UPI000A05F3C3|nr:DUF3644 domain-containing protein [Sciscionella marina]